MEDEPGLWILGQLFSQFLGEPKFWPEVCRETKDFVQNILEESADGEREKIYELGSNDLCVLSSFVHNKGSVKRFLASPYFISEEGTFTPWLVNLYRLAYKVASILDKDIVNSEDYKYLFSGDDIDIFRIIDAELNDKVYSTILRHNLKKQGDYY